MRAGSLFTGTAALDMAAGEVFGAKPAWFADVDPAASALLAHHYPGVPNLRDITAVDWDLVAVLAPVELVALGWPCQPFSLAGKQKGADDERALWPDVDRCLRALRPRYVLLENVPAVVGAELGRVADTLASLGYRFAWVCVPASAVGAPHRRERFFCVAVADTEDERHERPGDTRRRRPGPADCRRAVADPGRDARPQDDPNGPAAARGRGAAAAPSTEQPRLDWAGYTLAIRRWETVLGRPAPAPTVRGARGGRVLNPELPEWMMGLPAGWITGVPGLSRAQQLKLVGNGVVLRQAVAAYRYLLGVLDEHAGTAA